MIPGIAQADVGDCHWHRYGCRYGSRTYHADQWGFACVARAIDSFQTYLRTIKQNLFWAFFYNVILIPAAAADCSTPCFWPRGPWLSASVFVSLTVCDSVGIV